MKAVNLIPANEAAASRAGRSGGGVYVLLGVLAVAVVLAGAWAHLGAQVREKDAQAARVEAQAAAAEAKTNELKAYTAFTSLREKRGETVRRLAASRFDWPHALRDVARTIPAKAWVTGLRATVSQNVAVDGTADPLRSSLPVPAVELVGCARTQADVARTLVAMRQVDGVQHVSLSSSSADANGGKGSCGDGAPAGSPQFSMTVFFNAVAATGSATTAPATTTGGSTP
jgi:Tfp pilus assembly protein PilN